MSARFTSGPWSAIGNTIYSLFFARGYERNKWNCTIYGDVDCPREELQAVAHLIAAAPELYAALEKMLEWNARESDHAVSFDERVNLCDEAFCMARAALKAARGEA